MEQIYLNAFNQIRPLGPVNLMRLVNYFPSLETAWLKTNEEGFKNSGINQKIAKEIIIKRGEIDPKKEWQKLEDKKIKIISFNSREYPPFLKEIPDPPALLYYKGDISLMADKCFAIVGTRNYTEYGKEATMLFASELANAGLTIVSGLAKGIDGFCHKAVLDSGGKTIAVLGSGLDEENIYPSQNRFLAKEISNNRGLVISEFPVGTGPWKQNFPQRNRIISGLSVGVLVIEAPEKSGALITANFALEQNRDVFALPGPIFSRNSLGPNNLIKLGAKPATEAKDIIEELGLSLPEENNKELKLETEEEKILWKIIRESGEPLHIDKIIENSGLAASKVTSSLTMMEIKGAVKSIGKGTYTT